MPVQLADQRVYLGRYRRRRRGLPRELPGVPRARAHRMAARARHRPDELRPSTAWCSRWPRSKHRLPRARRGWTMSCCHVTATSQEARGASLRFSADRSDVRRPTAICSCEGVAAVACLDAASHSARAAFPAALIRTCQLPPAHRRPIEAAMNTRLVDHVDADRCTRASSVQLVHGCCCCSRRSRRGSSSSAEARCSIARDARPTSSRRVSGRAPICRSCIAAPNARGDAAGMAEHLRSRLPRVRPPAPAGAASTPISCSKARSARCA